MEAYKTWVRRNKEYVHSLESLANGLTWLLPERFSTSEIGPEAAIKELETLVEVAAQYYYGDDKKWDFIAVTEATKVLFRLAMFQSGGYKMLLHGGEVSCVNYDPDNKEQLTKPGISYQAGLFNVRSLSTLEGKAMFALNRFGENARMGSDPLWFQRVQQHQETMKPPARVIARPSLSTVRSEKGIQDMLFILGEVLFIARPLVYVLLIRKFRTRSWIPWFLSLAVDLIGVGFLTTLSRSKLMGKEQQFQLTDSERNELKRRKLLWALHLMRDPFFSKYTRQKLEGTEKLLEPVPIIGLLTAKIVELVIGAQSRYTYMSGS